MRDRARTWWVGGLLMAAIASCDRRSAVGTDGDVRASVQDTVMRDAMRPMAQRGGAPGAGWAAAVTDTTCPQALRGKVVRCVRWSGGNGHLYAVMDVKMYYTEAESAAARLPAVAESPVVARHGVGGSGEEPPPSADSARPHLASLTSEAERLFVRDSVLAGLQQPMPSDAPLDAYWLGATAPGGQVRQPSAWQWATGEPWVYTAWNSGEPNYGNETALSLWGTNAGSSREFGKWNNLLPGPLDDNKLHRIWALVEWEPLTLACTSPVRGNEVTCTVPGSQGTVVGWRFLSGSIWDFFRGIERHEVKEALVSNSWSGTAAADGEVWAFLRGGSSLKTTLKVKARDWRWTNNDMTFTEGGAPVIDSLNKVPFPPTNESGWVAGINCAFPRGHPEQCGANFFQPSPLEGDYGGFVLESIPTGPNKGFHFVRNADLLYSNAASQINPHMRPESGTTFKLPMDQARECAGLAWEPDSTTPDTTDRAKFANFHTFNSVCKNVDMSEVFKALWLHEGYGSTGTNGHQSMHEKAALNDLDPRRAVEPLWHISGYELMNKLDVLFEQLEDGIQGLGEPTGNYRGAYWWAWNSTSKKYEKFFKKPF